MTNNKFSIKKRALSFKYAFQGIKSLLVYEHNMRIHWVAAIAVIVLGALFNLSSTEWCIIIITIAVVMAAEAFNTAIEKLTDKAYPEQSPNAGFIKDVSAAGVLITAISALIIGLIIFLPKIFGI